MQTTSFEKIIIMHKNIAKKSTEQLTLKYTKKCNVFMDGEIDKGRSR